MLVIRLQRTGRRNNAAYRIVVAEKTAPVKGRCLQILGHYLPTRDPAVVECDTEKAAEWIKKGAVPSTTVARLLAKHGMKDLEKFISSYSKKRPKKEPEPEPEPAPTPAAEAPAPEAEPEKVEENPAEEPKEEEKTEEAPAEEPKEEEKTEEPKEASDTEADDKKEE